MSATFYKMRLIPDEQGLAIITERFISIRETECVHFCVKEFELGLLRSSTPPNESLFEAAKRRRNLKIHRINKNGSRIAQPTEQAAFDHLLFLKRKHAKHLKRDLEMIEIFVKQASDNALDAFEADRYGRRTIHGTEEWVFNNYTFY